MTNSRTAEPPPAWVGGRRPRLPLLDLPPFFRSRMICPRCPPHPNAAMCRQTPAPVRCYRLVRTDAQLVRPWLDTKYAASLGIRASTRAQYSGCAAAQNINSPRSQKFLNVRRRQNFSYCNGNLQIKNRHKGGDGSRFPVRFSAELLGPRR